MKKYLSFVLIFAVAFSSLFLTGCDTTESERENDIKNQIYSYYEDIKLIAHEKKDDKSFVSALGEYMEGMDLRTEDAGGGGIAVTVPADKGYEKAEKQVLISEYSKEHEKENCQVIAMTLTSVINSTAHGEIKYIIVPAEDSEGNSGISDVKKEILKGDNVIYTMPWKKTELFSGSAGSSVYTMKSSMNFTAPLGTVAYRIRISGINEELSNSGDRSETHKNPITAITDTLSSARNSGMNIELASFSSTGNMNIYPQGAEAVVVIDKSAKTKFETKLESAKEKFMEDTGEKDEGAVFEYEETDMPSLVLGYNDSAEFLSLMFTLIDGVFQTSEPDYEGDVTGITTVYSAELDASSGGATVSLIGRYTSEDVRKDMNETYRATAQLSDFTISQKEIHDIWMPDQESEFYTENILKSHLEERDIDRKFKVLLQDSVFSHADLMDSESNRLIMGMSFEESLESVMALIDTFDQSASEK